MTEEERIFSGKLFVSEEPELVAKKLKAHRLSQEFNDLFEEDIEARQSILQKLLEDIGEGTIMLGPIRFHYGCHTKIGNHCFMNFNFTVQDDAQVRIGNHCNFGPNVTIVTPLHPMLPLSRLCIQCYLMNVGASYAVMASSDLYAMQSLSRLATIVGLVQTLSYARE